MATLAHCAYCFEILASTFDNRTPLTLSQVEELWNEYNADPDEEDSVSVNNEGIADSIAAKPAAVSRILLDDSTGNTSPSASSLSSHTSSLGNSKSPTPASSTSKTSSMSSFFSRSEKEKEPSHPLFITWNTISKSGHKSLRGCIGTFSPQPLSKGLQDYSIISALEDHRFSPIPDTLLSSLQVCVTLLTNFSEPDKDVFNWTIGEHGIKLSFYDKGRRYNATYLPDVALEQGWTKEEAITSLMRKAGWVGKRDEWKRLTSFEIVRYEGKKVTLDYVEWKEWRDWVNSKDGKKGRR